MTARKQTAKYLIQLLMKEVYPSIQYHFLMMVWKGDFLLEEKKSGTEEVLSNLRTEFNSLYTYETKLVFPAVLKAFDENTTNQPSNISELIVLTQKKEHRIKQLIEDLKESMVLQGEENATVSQLIATFEEDFFSTKEDWNSMVSKDFSAQI